MNAFWRAYVVKQRCDPATTGHFKEQENIGYFTGEAETIKEFLEKLGYDFPLLEELKFKEVTTDKLNALIRAENALNDAKFDVERAKQL